MKIHGENMDDPVIRGIVHDYFEHFKAAEWRGSTESDSGIVFTAIGHDSLRTRRYGFYIRIWLNSRHLTLSFRERESHESNRITFDLADPNSINNIREKLDELLITRR